MRFLGDGTGMGHETRLYEGHGPCGLKGIPLKECFMKAQVIVHNSISIAGKRRQKETASCNRNVLIASSFSGVCSTLSVNPGLFPS